MSDLNGDEAACENMLTIKVRLMLDRVVCYGRYCAKKILAKFFKSRTHAHENIQNGQIIGLSDFLSEIAGVIPVGETHPWL